MYKQVFFLLVVILHFGAFAWLSARKKQAWFLLVSFYIISIPLRMHIYLPGPVVETPAGTLGNTLFIPIVLVLFFTFLFYNESRVTIRDLRLNAFSWINGVLLLFFISIFNPFNVSKFTTLVFLVFFVSHILFLRLLYILVKPRDVLFGIFIGLSFITLIHFITSLLFPLLNYEPATAFFDIEGTEGATRLGTRTGAIGMFNHPNTLAVFTGICISFFMSCWLNKYFTRLSLIALGMGVITMFLTYSRTAYLVFLAVVFLLFYIHKYPHKPLVSLENIIKIMLPFALVLGWFIFLSPFSALFLESDVDQQVGNREMHFAMALEAFQVSPFIGIGMNTHLEFFKEYYYLLSFLDLNEFFYENHIHNIHLIILAEAGSIGLLLWILFLFVNIGRAKKQLARGRNQILSLTQIGLIIIYFLNGFTDWAPFSSSIMPLFLFLMYFSIKYRRGNRVRVRAISRRPAYNLASSDSTVAAT